MSKSHKKQPQFNLPLDANIAKRKSKTLPKTGRIFNKKSKTHRIRER